MEDFERLQRLVDDEKVKFSISLPKDLHKRLVLGQTRYVCRYGTLSEGHEKITPSQRYYQAIKEMYYLGQNILTTKASAMEAQAELLDGEEALGSASTEASKLRAQAKILKAKTALTSALVTVDDQMRMLDEYDKIRRELGASVEAQYPMGIEQAEEDNWRAVAEFRLMREKVPGLARERLDNIPLAPTEKAKLGFKHDRLDAIAPLKIAQPELFVENSGMITLLEIK